MIDNTPTEELPQYLSFYVQIEGKEEVGSKVSFTFGERYPVNLKDPLSIDHCINYLLCEYELLS